MIHVENNWKFLDQHEPTTPQSGSTADEASASQE